MRLSGKEDGMGKTYVFRGRRYSIDSATKCGSYGPYTLYKKRTGEFFIYNTEEDKIKPVKYEAAKEWASKHIPGAMKYFEGSSAKKVTSFSLSTDTIEKAKELAVKLGFTTGQVIEEAIRQLYSTIK